MKKIIEGLGMTFLKSGWYVTPASYARLHNMSRAAVHKRIQRGQLFSHQVGGWFLIWLPGNTSAGVIANIKPRG